MKEEGHETRDELFREAANGNEDAYNYLVSIMGIAHTWDDLIDKDRVLTDANIHDAFTAALLTLPANPFYQRYRSLLDSVLLMSTVNWRAATNAERKQPSEWTFIVRSSYVDLIVLVRLLTSGMESSVEFAEKVREAAHYETYTGYLIAFEDENRARGKA